MLIMERPAARALVTSSGGASAPSDAVVCRCRSIRTRCDVQFPRSGNYTLKDEPQPQVDFAFGFLIVKPPPVTLSTKSTSAPRRYRALIGSTSSLTPFDSMTASVVASPSPSSIIRPYWNPEQPPPCTKTRSPASSLFSSVSNCVIFEAAEGVTLIMGSYLQNETIICYSVRRQAPAT